MTWCVRALRLTAFLFPPDVGETPSWSQVAGLEADPETFIRRAGLEQADGPFGGGQLAVNKQLPLRLDVIYSSVDRQDEPDDQFLGSFDQAIATFSPIVPRVLTEDLPVQRIALGVSFVERAKDRETAYEILTGHIRTTKFHLEGAEDFIYQINRPRTSAVVPELRINRLTKWVCIREVFRMLDTVSKTLASGDERLSAWLETDISTPAEHHEPFAAEKASELWSELEALTSEIVKSGDVP